MSKRFLIVDDDELCRNLLQNLLAKFGSCEMAENGREGLAFFKEALAGSDPYDLICVDLIMPNMNGHMLIREIRDFEQKQQTPFHAAIFAITSIDSIYEKSELLLGNLCDHYVVKPFNAASITADLHKYVLGNSR